MSDVTMHGYTIPANGIRISLREDEPSDPPNLVSGDAYTRLMQPFTVTSYVTLTPKQFVQWCRVFPGMARKRWPSVNNYWQQLYSRTAL